MNSQPRSRARDSLHWRKPRLYSVESLEPLVVGKRRSSKQLELSFNGGAVLARRDIPGACGGTRSLAAKVRGRPLDC
jgi:hypothetical protein